MKKTIKYLSILFAISFIWLGFTHQVEAKTPDNDFWIEYIDVGQGDAALIQCDGHYMMIDGGPSGASSQIYTILKNGQIDKLDYMIATHPDEDHIGGLSGALNYAKVAICYSPTLEHDTKAFQSLVKYAQKQGTPLVIPDTGTKFQLGSAAIEILGPIVDDTETNNNSIVVKVTYGSTSFLFMGDAEREEEFSLVRARKDLSCDVLKLGHHGSDSSTTYTLLNAARPVYAVISVGADNTYGHPTETVLKKLEARKIDVYRTDLQGDVYCISDGTKITFDTVPKEKSVDALKESAVGGSAVGAISELIIPEGTTYVINQNSKVFHVTTCGSVKDMAEKNRVYSTDSAETIVAAGYKPCGNCKPYTEPGPEKVIPQEDRQQVPVGSSYVLNKNTKKFHVPSCSSVGDMSAKNRKDVVATRDEIIAQGYVPCKRCHP